MKKCFYPIQVICFLFLSFYSSVLFGTDCKDIFSFAQQPSFKNGLSVVDLSKIPSRYKRFIRSVADPSNEYGYLQADYKVGEASDSDRILYPIVTVDLYSKGSESILKLDALVISPKEVLLALSVDDYIDINSFEIYYKNLNLTVTKEFSYDHKNFYQLSSPSELSVSPANFLSPRDALRDEFSLRYIPQNEKDILSFILPEAGSMVKLFLRSNIITKARLVDNTTFKNEQKFKEELGFKGKVFEDPNNGILDINTLMSRFFDPEILNEESREGIQELAIRRVVYDVAGFISYASELYFDEYKQKLEGKNSKFKWALRVIPVIAKILSFDTIIDSYTGTFVSHKGLLGYRDPMSLVSTSFLPNNNFYKYSSEKWIRGFDEEIEKLVDLYLGLQDRIHFSTIKPHLLLIDDVSRVDLKSALRSAFKRVIWSMGRILYLKDKEFFEKDRGSKHYPHFEGYATVVSSNTIITSKDSLFTMLKDNLSRFSDLVSVKKGNHFIDAIDIHEISVPGPGIATKSILVIRFPDGTFDDLPQVQVGTARGNEYGILVSESNFNNDNIALSLVKIEKSSSTNFDQSRVLRNADLIENPTMKPYTLKIEACTDPNNNAINFKRSGYPIFEKRKLVGILDGSHTNPNVIKLSEDLLSKIKELTKKDPKLKIGGINY